MIIGGFISIMATNRFHSPWSSIIIFLKSSDNKNLITFFRSKSYQVQVYKTKLVLFFFHLSKQQKIMSNLEPCTYFLKGHCKLKSFCQQNHNIPSCSQGKSCKLKTCQLCHVKLCPLYPKIQPVLTNIPPSTPSSLPRFLPSTWPWLAGCTIWKSWSENWQQKCQTWAMSWLQ